jgi:magnesium-transporting ATPase (P-type)
MVTAKAIATDCGIYTDGVVMEGPDFRRFTDEQFDDASGTPGRIGSWIPTTPSRDMSFSSRLRSADEGSLESAGPRPLDGTERERFENVIHSYAKQSLRTISLAYHFATASGTPGRIGSWIPTTPSRDMSFSSRLRSADAAGPRPLDGTERERFENVILSYAKQSLRTISLAYRDVTMRTTTPA